MRITIKQLRSIIKEAAGDEFVPGTYVYYIETDKSGQEVGRRLGVVSRAKYLSKYDIEYIDVDTSSSTVSAKPHELELVHDQVAASEEFAAMKKKYSDEVSSPNLWSDRRWTGD